MSTTEKPSVEKLVKVFIKIREKRAAAKREFEEADKELEAQQDMIKAELLNHCNEHDVNSVNTAAGTFYRKVRTNYWTSDWAAFHKFILEHKVPELLSNRIQQTNLKTFMEENPDLHPPGLNVDSEYSVTVNKPRKK